MYVVKKMLKIQYRLGRKKTRANITKKTGNCEKTIMTNYEFSIWLHAEKIVDINI